MKCVPKNNSEQGCLECKEFRITLTHLKDGSVIITPLTSMQICTGAAALLQRGTKLKKLSLFANKLGDEGASEIADALSAGCYVHLQELDMSANNIGIRGVKRLCDVLESQAAPALEVRIQLFVSHSNQFS